MRGALACIGCLFIASCGGATDRTRVIAGADAGNGRKVIERVGCATCHEIPGVRWPRGVVGPSLKGFADRTLIAGQHPNQPDVLAVFVRDAPSLSPRTGMPAMPLTDQEARDVAAYLLTLSR